MSQPYLEFFTASEFVISGIDWWSSVDSRLLVLHDVLRFQWGEAITVSPASGSVGRRLGPDNTSQHNIDKWGEVRAIDSMPEGLKRADCVRKFINLARQCGFTGIGVYPHWQPFPGVHLDVRRGQQPGNPATWGAVDENKATSGQKRRGEIVNGQVYLSLDEAVAAFPT